MSDRENTYNTDYNILNIDIVTLYYDIPWRKSESIWISIKITLHNKYEVKRNSTENSSARDNKTLMPFQRNLNIIITRLVKIQLYKNIKRLINYLTFGNLIFYSRVVVTEFTRHDLLPRIRNYKTIYVNKVIVFKVFILFRTVHYDVNKTTSSLKLYLQFI